MIAIIDYGVGNLFSLSSSLKYLGADCKVTGEAAELRAADKIILPGVGAFGDAAGRLRQSGLWETVVEEAHKGKYLLGICLGMQLLFDKGYEYGEHAGLGLIPGEICPLQDDLDEKGLALKVPHIGWNALHIQKQDPLFAHFPQGGYVYYVHSFYAKGCEESTLAVSDYGLPVTGAVRRGSVYGTQFHPEKSGGAGLGLLKAFTEL